MFFKLGNEKLINILLCLKTVDLTVRILIFIDQYIIAFEPGKCNLFVQELSFYGFCMRDYSR